jgi:type VI secretion system secreted protein Hcp
MKTGTSLTVLIFGIFILSAIGFSEAYAAGYIKFDGVDGESKDANHDKWIDITSFQQTITRAQGAVRATPVFEDIQVVKEVDKSSPKLAESLAREQMFPSVIIHFTKSIGGVEEQTYYTYELKNVMITSYSIGGTADTLPREEISLNFEEIKATYTEYDDKSGQKKGNVEYSWKVEEGTK